MISIQNADDGKFEDKYKDWETYRVLTDPQICLFARDCDTVFKHL